MHDVLTDDYDNLNSLAFCTGTSFQRETILHITLMVGRGEDSGTLEKVF